MNLAIGLFWLAFTVALYLAAKQLHRRYPRFWLSPIIAAPALIVAILLCAGVPYSAYAAQSHWLSVMLGPATIAFAIPIYEQRGTIRRNWLALLVGVIVGMTVAVVTTAALSRLLGLSDILERSLALRSISTPFALIATPEVGGKADIAAIAVVITGLIGMVLGEWLLNWLPLRSVLARGALFGAGAHAVGTATAHKRDPEEGVIASLTMIIAGVLMVLLAPYISPWL